MIVFLMFCIFKFWLMIVCIENIEGEFEFIIFNLGLIFRLDNLLCFINIRFVFCFLVCCINWLSCFVFCSGILLSLMRMLYFVKFVWLVGEFGVIVLMIRLFLMLRWISILVGMGE